MENVIEAVKEYEILWICPTSPDGSTCNALIQSRTDETVKFYVFLEASYQALEETNAVTAIKTDESFNSNNVGKRALFREVNDKELIEWTTNSIIVTIFEDIK